MSSPLHEPPLIDPLRDTGFQPVQGPLLRHRPHRTHFFCYLLLSLSTFLFAQGCCPRVIPPDKEAFRPNPPLRSVADVVHAINSNNQKIPSLWATLNYSATIREENGREHSVTSNDGNLLYVRPNFFRLIGNKEFVGPVFDLGANDREFWLELKPTNQMFSATFAQLAHAGTFKFPIRPDLVAEVLGVGTFNVDLLQPPLPIMRYEAATDSYVFLFALQATYHWFPQKQVWYERTTLRPRRVMLYDAEGRPQLDARLSSDTPVQDPDHPRPEWPLIAGDYKLFFPEEGHRMEFTLKDVRLYKQGTRIKYPNPNSFEKPDITGTDVHQEPIRGLNVE